MKDKSVGLLLDMRTKTEAMIKECGKVDAPLEPLALDSATKAIPSLGTITLQRIELLNSKRASAGELRRAKAIEAERAVEAAANFAARHDENAHALAQPANPPSVEVVMHLDIYMEIEGYNESGELIHYKQWLAVEIVSSSAL